MFLIDSDVLMDVALDRHPHVEHSAEFLSRLEQGSERGFLAWHTVSNLFYNIERHGNRAYARSFIVDVLDLCSVVTTGDKDIHYALTLPMSDFEDAMQAAAAVACRAQYIVTRNDGDYGQSPISSIPPLKALALLR